MSQGKQVPLTDRQIKYMAARISGKTREQAVREAGYSEETSPTQVEKSGNLKKALIQAMEVKGLTSEKLAEKLAKGVDATKKIFFTYKGEFRGEREVSDNETQHKYVKTALEIRGDLQPEQNQMNVNIGLIEVPKMAKDADSWNNEYNASLGPEKGQAA